MRRLPLTLRRILSGPWAPQNAARQSRRMLRDEPLSRSMASLCRICGAISASGYAARLVSQLCSDLRSLCLWRASGSFAEGVHGSMAGNGCPILQPYAFCTRGHKVRVTHAGI